MTSMQPAGVQDHVRLIAAEIVLAATAADHRPTHLWGFAPWPDHSNRRCVDYMIEDWDDGQWVAHYHQDHSARLGVHLVIWSGRIWRAYPKDGRPARSWSPYAGENPHRDHVHAEYEPGRYVPPAGEGVGVWRVDPQKVQTWLWQVRRDGTRGKKRPPGFLIGNGVGIETIDGHKWLRTAAGNRYALRYLTRVS